MMESHLLIDESDFPALLLIYIHQSYQRTYLTLRLISITHRFASVAHYCLSTTITWEDFYQFL